MKSKTLKIADAACKWWSQRSSLFPCNQFKGEFCHKSSDRLSLTRAVLVLKAWFQSVWHQCWRRHVDDQAFQ